MGATGVVCVFDHARYLREVVPALRALPAFARFDDDELTASSEGRPAPIDRERAIEYERLCDLFERHVTPCLSHVEIVGRAYRIIFTLSRDFCAQHVSDEAEWLILKLDSHARFWTHGSGGFSEGIHGWLDPHETERFAREVVGIEPDPDSTEPARVRDRIARIAQVAARAAAERRGLLWGADLAILR